MDDFYYLSIMSSASIVTDEMLQFQKATRPSPIKRVECEYCHIIQPLADKTCCGCGAPLKEKEE